MHIHIVDPPAYTPPYDHALSRALAAQKDTTVELFTSTFGYGPSPAHHGYQQHEFFYRFAPGTPGSRARRGARFAQHGPDMLRYRRRANAADIVHFQWLTVQHVDAHLLPRKQPLVLTAHDVLPREPRRGQHAAQTKLYNHFDAIIVHSHHGKERLTNGLEVPPEKIHVVEHGVFDYLTCLPNPQPLPKELTATKKSVVLCFGLMRPYKGIDVLVEGWKSVDADAELWIVGLPKMDISSLQKKAPATVRWVPKFITDPEIPAYFQRADLVVLPYKEIDQSGVLFTALAFGKPLLASAVGGFPEIAQQGAAQLTPPNDPDELAKQINDLLHSDTKRNQLAAQANTLAKTDYSWRAIAEKTRALYQSIST